MARQLAKQKLVKSQAKMKHLFDQHSQKHRFIEGDQVLALLPVVGLPFQAKFVGLYTVVRQLSEQNYLIATPDRRKRNQLYHIDLLKPYYVQTPSQVKSVSGFSPSEIGPVLTSCTVVFRGGGGCGSA